VAALRSKEAFRRLGVEIDAATVRVALNHQPLNVIDLEMMGELAAVLEQAEQIPQVTAIVLGGSERGFSAGVEIGAHAPEQVRETLTSFHGVIRAMEASSKVTIAAVRRHCLGGGAELAMMCDIVYATPDSVWGFPEIKLACFPPVACAALAAIVGPKLAAEMILTGRTLTGEEAVAAGLVTAIADDPEALVRECLSRLAQLSPAALKVAKKAFYAWDAIHFDKGLARAEQIYLDELMKTEDAAEGVRAHIERRRPTWKGK